MAVTKATKTLLLVGASTYICPKGNKYVSGAEYVKPATEAAALLKAANDRGVPLFAEKKEEAEDDGKQPAGNADTKVAADTKGAADTGTANPGDNGGTVVKV